MSFGKRASGAVGLVVGFLISGLVVAAGGGPAAAGVEDGPAVAQAPADGCVSVTISAGAYRIEQTVGGAVPTVDGFGSLRVAGKPRLPSKIFAVAIPPGAEVVEVTFDAVASEILPGAYEVAPTPLSRVIGQEDPQVLAGRQAEYEANHRSVYTNDDAYPAATAELVRLAGFRRYNLVDVRVTPFSYRPMSGRLVYHPEVTVHVHYAPAEVRSGAVDDHSARAERLAQELIVNHQQALDWYPQERAEVRGLYDYVIITLDSLTSAVTPLVNWETAKGRTVQVVTTTWIDSNYTGYDQAERMRNFLRDKYPSGEWGIEDVLIVGHYDDVPMRRTAQDLGYGAPETDYYYAELSLPDDQSWDDDVDHQYGENTDPIDFYAEVIVGRIPYSDTGTVTSICNKSVAYEQNNDPIYKKNMLLLAAFFWDDDPNPRTDNAVLMETKVDQTWMSDWTLTRMYEDGYSTYPMDYNLTNANVVSVWSSGTFGFVNWAGHGSPTSAHVYHGGQPAFITAGDASQLNDNYPSIVFADSCSNQDTDYNNIARAILGHGAVGFVGATKVALGCPGWSGPYSGSSQSMDYFFTTGVTSGYYTQGAAHQYALQEMYTYGLWDYQRYEAFEWGAFLGNPNLTMAPVLTSGISVTPWDSFLSEGPNGGPFVPGSTIYTIENLGPDPIDYSVTKTEAWLTITNGSGSLNVSQTADVTVSINSSADSLGDGAYTDTLNFINTTDHVGDTTRGVSLAVGVPVPVYTWTLDSDPGWTTTGLWAFGQPTGGGGQYGGPDPTSGHTGTNVYGYNLSGDYENGLIERHLTTTAIDCTGLSRVAVGFWRWLGVEQPAYDHAYVRVSNNGTSWTTVWENSAEITDSSWTQVQYDISAVADNEPTVYVRWTMGTTDVGWQYCGWNIDDIQILALGGGDDCSNGVLDTGEDRIDCGGPCPPCDCTADGECDNGTYCDGAETCDAYGTCQAGPPVDCPDDGLFCNGTEFCDEDADACASTGDPCVLPEVCDEGADMCVLESTTISSVACCMDQGGTEYCLGMAKGGSATVEPRQGGVSELVLQTADPVEAGSTTATATCVNNVYGGTVTVVADGTTTVMVTLDPLPDQDCCTIEFDGGIVDSVGVRLLAGDVNGDGSVSTADASSIKQRMGIVVGASDFWYDVNMDGNVSTADASSIKQRLGNVAPACP
ncbi:MAG TPA: C25 family cysteine peptidase [Phycisphaerae bacterium]|nr:C25 family cysteine peptidase [Phycisphaerae bacterium]